MRKNDLFGPNRDADRVAAAALTSWESVYLAVVGDVSLYSCAAERSDPENSMSLLLTNANRIFDARTLGHSVTFWQRQFA